MAAIPTEKSNASPVILEYERAYLGSLLTVPQRAALELTQPRDFLLDLHQRIRRALEALAARDVAPDYVLLCRELKATAEESAGISQLLEVAGAPANAALYACHIAAAASERRIQEAGARLASSPEQAAQVAQQLRDELAASVSGSQSWIDARIAWPDFADRYYERPESIAGDGLLVKGCLATLVGNPGTGKSYLLTQLAIYAARGESWLGLQPPARPMKVTLMTLEVPAYEMQNRLQWLGGEARSANLGILCYPELTGAVDLMQGEQQDRFLKLCEHQDLVIIEPLRRVHTGTEKDDKDMAIVLGCFERATRETGTCVLYGHHERKSQAGGKGDAIDASSGTGRLTSDPTVVWRLEKKGERLRLSLVLANHGAQHEPIWIQPVPQGVPIVVKAPEEVGAQHANAIREFLAANPEGLTLAQLASLTDLAPRTVRRHLKELEAIILPGTQGRGKIPVWTERLPKLANRPGHLSLVD